jgi:hypothetical protein
MHNQLELAKAYVRANIEDPACICYGVRAAMADGSELFKLTNAELVELHAFVSEVVEPGSAWASGSTPWNLGPQRDTGMRFGFATP